MLLIGVNFFLKSGVSDEKRSMPCLYEEVYSIKAVYSGLLEVGLSESEAALNV